jgi:hypothetical protein
MCISAVLQGKKYGFCSILSDIGSVVTVLYLSILVLILDTGLMMID